MGRRRDWNRVPDALARGTSVTCVVIHTCVTSCCSASSWRRPWRRRPHRREPHRQSRLRPPRPPHPSQRPRLPPRRLRRPPAPLRPRRRPRPRAPVPAKPRATTGTRTTTPAAPGRSGLALTVADMSGRMLPGVQVQVQGPTIRQDQTNDIGKVNFSQLQAGTYRLRFSGDAVTQLDRDVTLATGKITELYISLSPAPPPREIIKEVPAPAQEAPRPVVGPLGQTQLMSLYAMAEKELKTKAPKRETLVACSGNLRSTMVILAEKEQMQRKDEGAEVSDHVLGGDGTVQIGKDETNLTAGGYVAMPRGVGCTIAPKGKNSLALLSLLSGEPCEQAK